MRRAALFAATGAALLALCAGCRGLSARQQQSGPQPTPVTATTTVAQQAGTGDPGSDLAGLQSTLDSIQAQLSADSQP